MPKEEVLRKDFFTVVWLVVLIGILLIVVVSGAIGGSNGENAALAYDIGAATSNVGMMAYAALLFLVVEAKRKKTPINKRALTVFLVVGGLIVALFLIGFAVSQPLRKTITSNLNYISSAIMFIFTGLLVYFEYLDVPEQKKKS